jgi:3-deoxy-7-phosphoheptulonate synthase
MFVEMVKGATAAQIAAVNRKAKSLNLTPHINKGVDLVGIGLFGSNTGQMDTQQFEVLPGVARVVRIEKQYKAASRQFKKEDSIVNVNGVDIGGKNDLVIIAGPCTVESEDQLMECAAVVKAAGCQGLRGGLFKPRTSPFTFQGLGIKGLKMMQKAKEKFGLFLVSEVTKIENIEPMSKVIDVFQVGARNMQNFELLKALAGCGKPIILKRGISADIETEWLCAADYLLNGNQKPNVILCERGIKTFEKSVRYSLDLSSIPVVRDMSHLPIIADPSHAAGNCRYVPALARGAVAVGAQGLIIEIHPDPKNALCDGAHALSLRNFVELMDRIHHMEMSRDF